MKELMRIEGLKMYFGGLKAIDGFDLSIYEGETLGIIGPTRMNYSRVISVLDFMGRALSDVLSEYK